MSMGKGKIYGKIGKKKIFFELITANNNRLMGKNIIVVVILFLPSLPVKAKGC